ncbi:MAG: hypothetical protein KDK99_01775 [Verrucomicrobiales bacterium]|nr:hypothetical protein [Verrucomicrobiales bacterium]
MLRWTIALLHGLFCLRGVAADAVPPLADLSTVPPDLQIPELSPGPPAPGRRVALTTSGWRSEDLHHLLYLPTDWTPDRSWPVLVEYAGNGGYRNAFGDRCDGTVEGSRLGYGLSGGQGCLWLCLPFVEKTATGLRAAETWWGDVEQTKRYAIATVREVCRQWQGDEQRVILCGFSRGAIGCNFIGLHDDAIARLWRAFFCHSHYDGVRERWPYAGADRASALRRLQRLGGRPQWISHEGSVQATQAYLEGCGVTGEWTFQAIPFRNHSDAWLLRPLPERAAARAWLQGVLSQPSRATNSTGQ